MQPTDAELIKAVMAGDQAAFAELVRRYHGRVAVVVKSVVGLVPQDELADIVQDIFVLIYKALPSFRGESQFGTYITSIALRHCYREAKRRRKRRATFFSYDADGVSDRDPPQERFAGDSRTDRAVLAQERKDAVIRAMQQLPEEFRTVLLLRVVEEMPVEQVAAALEVSTGTVKSRLHRAKDKMRELLGNVEIDWEN